MHAEVSQIPSAPNLTSPFPDKKSIFFKLKSNTFNIVYAIDRACKFKKLKKGILKIAIGFYFKWSYKT